MTCLNAALCVVVASHLVPAAMRPAPSIVPRPGVPQGSLHGAITGQPSCNTFRAKYAGEGNRILIGPIAATRRVCSESVKTASEHDLLDSLEGSPRWIGQRDPLEKHRADRERAIPLTSRTK